MRMLFALIALATLNLLSAPAGAAVIKCKAKDGSITYTQTVCPPGTTNADFPEEADPNRMLGGGSSGSSGASGGRPSSPQAVMFMNSAVSCVEHENQNACTVIDEAVTICEPQKNWGSQTCIALREGLQAARSNQYMTDERSKQRLRQICAKGGELACALNECPLDMFVKGSDEQVRACAARASMPVSGSWVKMSGGGNGAGSYVCLRKVERVTSIGERLSSRVTINVVSFSPGPGAPTQFTASSLPDERFATSNAAANAGCEAATAQAMREPDSPRPAKRKGQQTI